MVSAVFCLVLERPSEQEPQCGAHPTPLHRNLGKVTSSHPWIGAATSTMRHFCPNSCAGPSPALSNRSAAASCSFPGKKPLPGCAWGKTTPCCPGGCRRRDGTSIALGLTPEPSSCLQHLLPPDLDREGSTQILCNPQSPTDVRITQCQSLKFSELLIQGLW